jgi:DNA-binding transcriptional LysR family regulator
VRGFPRVQRWYVVHRRHKRLPPVAQAFREFLRDEGAGLLARIMEGVPASPRAAGRGSG